MESGKVVFEGNEMNLRDAYVCLDCDEIGDSSVACRCSSRALMALRRIIHPLHAPKGQEGATEPDFDSLYPWPEYRGALDIEAKDI